MIQWKLQQNVGEAQEEQPGQAQGVVVGIEPEGSPPEEQDGVYIGMKVRHGKFGVGTVRKIEGEGEAQKVIVWFNSAGPKKLMLRFAGLERA